MIRYPRRPGWNVKGRAGGAGWVVGGRREGWGGGSELQAAKLGLWTPYAQSHQNHLYLITALLCVPEGEKKKKYKRDKRARLGSGTGNVKVNTQTQSLTPPPVGVRLSALQRPAPSPTPPCFNWNRMPLKQSLGF